MKKFLVVTLFSIVAISCDGGDEEVLIENGASCEMGDECNSGDCRLELKSPISPPYNLTGGMCTAECEFVEGGVQGTCEDGEVCLRYALGETVCFAACGEGNDCVRADEGYFCEFIGSVDVGACIPL